MRCPKAQMWISRRADGDLTAAQEQRLKGHLGLCAECRSYAQGLAGLDLDRFQVPEPAPDFTDRFMRRLDSLPEQHRPVLARPVVFRPLAAGLGAAAAVIGFAVGSFLFLSESTDKPQGTPTNGTLELAVGDAIDPSADDSVESVLIAMLPNGED